MCLQGGMQGEEEDWAMLHSSSQGCPQTRLMHWTCRPPELSFGVQVAHLHIRLLLISSR